MANKKNLKKTSFSNAKITNAEVEKAAKKLRAVSKGKLIGGIVAGVALVGGGIGAASYFATHNNVTTGGTVVVDAGKVIVDPTIDAKDATIGKLETDDSGNKVSIVTSETKIIANVKVTVGSVVLEEGKDYVVTPENEVKSSIKVTIKKETYDKYGSQGAFRITPEFAEKCLVLFDSEGGSEIRPLSVEMGQKITRPADPTKENFEFEGWWYTNDDGEYVEYDFDTPVNSNLILHAKWDVPVTTKGLGYYHDQYGYYVYCSEPDNLPTTVRIPEKYKDPITGIEGPVLGFAYIDGEEYGGFYGCSQIEEVILPNTIETICDDAFCGCTSLKRITIPSSVISIGQYAFGYCSNLENVTFNKGLRAIGQSAFYSSGVKKITLPETLETLDGGEIYPSGIMKTSSSAGMIGPDQPSIKINYGVFENCKNLTYVELNEGLNTIPEYCFVDCPNLAQISLPISIALIQQYAFNTINGFYNPYSNPTYLYRVILKDDLSEWVGGAQCYTAEDVRVALNAGYYLQKFDLYDENNEYAIQFLGYEDEEKTMPLCSVSYIGEEVTELTVPDTVTIDYYGEDVDLKVVRLSSNFDYGNYDENYTIKTLTLGKNIKSIAPGAFYYNNAIEEIKFNNNKVFNSIGEYAFYSSTIRNFNYPEAEEDEGVINLPESLEYLGDASFGYNDNITKVIINSDIMMNIGNKLDKWGDYYVSFPFHDSWSIKEYVVNDDNYYFASDEDTGALYTKLNDKINTLVAYPNVSEESNNTEVTIAEGAIGVEDIAFVTNGCYENMTKLSIPSSLQTFNNSFLINYYEDSAMTKLAKFDVAEGSKFFSASSDSSTLYNYEGDTLVKHAMGSHTSDYSYVIDEDVETIGVGAFYGDYLLKEIDLSNIKYLSNGAFYQCKKLTSIGTDNNLKNIISIDYSSLYDISIENIVIGPKCIYVNDYAISSKDLKGLYIDSLVIANLTQWNECIHGHAYIYIQKDIEINKNSIVNIWFDPKEPEPGDNYIQYINKY